MSENSANSTAELTRRLVRGEDAAYRMFYQTYSERLMRYLWVVARGDEVAARDALQNTLLRVVKYVRVFNDQATFWSWLTVLARSALRDAGRKHRRYFSFLDRFKHHVDGEIKGAKNVHHGETKILELLDQAVAALPEEERGLLVSRYFLPQSVRAIAEDSHSTEKAVQSKLARIRRKLKDSILAHLKNDRSL